MVTSIQAVDAGARVNGVDGVHELSFSFRSTVLAAGSQSFEAEVCGVEPQLAVESPPRLITRHRTRPWRVHVCRRRPIASPNLGPRPNLPPVPPARACV